MNSKPYVVIVDAFSSGALLAPFFKKLEYKIIHIQSEDKIAEWILKKFIPSDFEICLKAAEFPNILSILKYLSQFSIECIIPGSESGVLLADELSSLLQINKNNPDRALSRRSKFFMHETLKNHGLLHAKQIRSNSINEVLFWYEDQPFRKVILKPEYSALSEGVHFCQSKEELKDAFHNVIGTTNFYGIKHTEIVVQEYLSGPEYMVNTMSVNGEHFITDIWLGIDEDEEKLSGDLYATLIHPGEEKYNELASYVMKVLSSVGIHTGPAHVEVRYSPKGPVLIEIGARLPGGISEKAFSFATGLNPVALAVDSYVRPMEALKTLKKKREMKHARFVYFYSNFSGLIIEKPDLTRMYELESVQDILISMNLGGNLHKTSEIPGRQGYAYLANQNEKILEADYEKFLFLEQELYHNLLGISNNRDKQN